MLSREKYAPVKTDKGVSEGLKKNTTIMLEPVRMMAEEELPPALYTFDVDPIRGLKNDNPEAFLYLAYLLLAQKNYAQAAYYLSQAKDMKVSNSDVVNTMLKWMREWNDNSIQAIAVKMQLGAIVLEQQIVQSKSGQLKSEQLKLLHEVSSHYIQYQKAVKEGSLEPALQLSKQDETLLVLHCFEQSLALVQSVDNFVEHQVISRIARILPIGKKEAHEWYHKLKGMINETKKRDIKLGESLEKEIEALEATLAQRDVEAKSKKSLEDRHSELKETAIFNKDIKDFLAQAQEASAEQTEFWMKQIEKLKTAFHINAEQDGTYIQELGQELVTDLRDALQQRGAIRSQDPDNKTVQYVLKDPINLNDLRKEFAKQLEQSAAKVKILKDPILKNIQVPTKEKGWRHLKDVLEERAQILEKQFEESLFCYAAKDWSRLIETQVVKDDKKAIKELEKNIEAFLIEATHQQQLQQGLEILDKLIAEPNDDIKRQQLSNHLNLTRQYDPSTSSFQKSFAFT